MIFNGILLVSLENVADAPQIIQTIQKLRRIFR